MGIFGKSFTREVGKNTGKAVSNLIFGDMHSTPYRRVGATQYREPRKTAAELRHEREVERLEAEERVRRKQIEVENQRIKKEQLLSIDAAVLKNVDTVVSILIPNDKEELLRLLSELSTQVQANQWQREYNDDEQKIRNKYVNALFEKYSQCVLKLKAISPYDAQLEYFENILESSKSKKFWRKNRMWIGIMIAVALIVLFSAIGILVENDTFFDFGEGVIYFLSYLLGIFGIFVAYKVIKHVLKQNKKSELQKLATQSQTIPQKQNAQPMHEQQVSIPIVENPIFIDLNENNRIEDKLGQIWKRYNNSVDKKIVNRKPIFSADGIKDSILFIGVNPSYNPNDDRVFVHSEDDKSLMYGSLYQIPDAPEYFKILERFAARAGKAYSHINLLYARENDRDLLIGSDHNFIREQLELTYDTILKINPIVIVFFSDYCKSLIFGEDRWINPRSEKNEHFILKGTNYPVFFSTDITLLDEAEKRKLSQKIQKII